MSSSKHNYLSEASFSLSLSCLSAGKYWRSVHRSSPRLGLSLLEAKRGDSEEAEAVSAMASLSVANTNAMDQRWERPRPESRKTTVNNCQGSLAGYYHKHNNLINMIINNNKHEYNKVRLSSSCADCDLFSVIASKLYLLQLFRDKNMWKYIKKIQI